MEQVVRRRLAPIMTARSRVTPVLLLEGPRGVGKSTLLAAFATSAGTPVVDLDQDAYLQLARSSPSVVADGDVPVLVDEYQRAPGLLAAIKARLNRETRPGMFVLAGSASFDSLPPGTQALTGRLQRLAVMPFTQTEIDGTNNRFVERMFEGDVPLDANLASTTRDDYVERVMRGGMPLALAQPSDVDRSRWFEAHVRQSLERDAGELRRIGRRTNLRTVLTRLAGQTGGLLSVNQVGTDTRMSWDAVSRYIELLESLFLVQRLPAWGVTVLPRSVETPKIHVVDSGIGAHLLRLSPAKMRRLDPAALTEFGHLLESFVVQEVLRQAEWMEAPATAGHWRTRDNVEVDLVLERFDGSVVAIEVKASDHVDRSQLSGLAALRNRLGPAFVAGVAFHLGKAGYRADDRLFVLPVERLWT